MVKSISFIALTQFFNFNELKVLRQPGYFIFLQLNQQYFLQGCMEISVSVQYYFRSL